MDARRIDSLCESCYHFDGWTNYVTKKTDFCFVGMDKNKREPCSGYKTINREVNAMESARYYVFNPKKDKPVQPHFTLLEAENEARRIAEMEENTEILVVQAVIGITAPSKGFIYRNYKK